MNSRLSYNDRQVLIDPGDRVRYCYDFATITSCKTGQEDATTRKAIPNFRRNHAQLCNTIKYRKKPRSHYESVGRRFESCRAY
jgi:hypothetical protein